VLGTVQRLRALALVGLQVEDGEQHQVAVDDGKAELVAPRIERRAFAVEHVVVVERCQVAHVDCDELHDLQLGQVSLQTMTETMRVSYNQ